ncbi:hypothetical protein [Aestuariibaculum marinum]|uniref:Uncharacterized protein n=1 Tax=Aestuariibaculum marinum TaxID=2683592 RepID=A0A8J6UCS2_9FLAO|nr:hypothetical protein [Aestuariibaculum marinum]MBD0825223.1 hypothetical protein [Aestuariibaculum marinum]
MIKQNPFSVYDFLGYLIPGSIVIYSLLTIDYLKKVERINIDELIKNFSSVKIEGIFLFIILAYTTGHLISFVSSITIEKYANWRYGYPSKYLLGFENQGYWKSSSNWKELLWRICLFIFLFPCVLFDWIFGQLLGLKSFYTKPLDSFLTDLIKLKTNILLGNLGFRNMSQKTKYNRGESKKYDFYRILSHYAYENSKQHQIKMNNYIALYGFLRTISLIFNILTIYFIVRFIRFLPITMENILLTLILSAISYIAFMAFMKFYRRYTLEGLMIIAISENIKKQPSH